MLDMTSSLPLDLRLTLPSHRLYIVDERMMRRGVHNHTFAHAPPSPRTLDMSKHERTQKHTKAYASAKQRRRPYRVSPLCNNLTTADTNARQWGRCAATSKHGIKA